MLHKFGVKLFLAALLLGFSALFANASSAVVTTVDDTLGGGNCTTGGLCSLRQALAFVGSGDAIFFNLPPGSCPNGVCTINLQTGITIDKSMSIYGPGARNLIIKPSATASVASFTVLSIFSSDSSPISVNLSGMTISGGYNNDPSTPILAGGITINGATTSLNSVNVTNNQGDSAGGIFNRAGGLIIKNSLISNNSGKFCGGIYNVGGTELTNSTVSGNMATATDQVTAGGILNVFQLMVGIGNLTMINSTVAFNTSQSQLALSGGGVVNPGAPATVNARNSIIASNNSPNGNTDLEGAFISRGSNLVSNTSGSGGFGGSGSNDIVNQPANLAPLKNNGGQTDTHALPVDSPAVNAGNDCVLTLTCTANNPSSALEFDQRSQPYARKFSHAVDIGAFEFQYNKSQFDYDGDGKSDLSVFRANADPSFSDFQIRKSSDNQLLGYSWGLPGDKLAPADFDGDGKTDIAVWRESEGKFYILNSSNSSLRIENFGLAGDILTVGDYDNDGKADLATYRAGAQSTFFYLGSLNNPAGNITYLPWGTSGDKPLHGDFDGDGKLDAAVFRPSNGVWYILQSSNGQARYENFGLASDKLVPADYDGDGKTDLAVFRNGIWFKQLSSNNQIIYTNFGISSDTPVPADYDGDGKADIAFFRSSEGNWYVFQPVGNSISVVNFGQNGDAPVPGAFIP